MNNETLHHSSILFRPNSERTLKALSARASLPTIPLVLDDLDRWQLRRLSSRIVYNSLWQQGQLMMSLPGEVPFFVYVNEWCKQSLNVF
jgi:hypothetical protein